MKASPTRDSFELKVDSIDCTVYSTCTVKGTATNKGNRTIRYWKATTRYKNKAGEVVDTGMVNSLTELGPGDSDKFTDMISGLKGRTWVDVQVDEVSLK